MHSFYLLSTHGLTAQENADRKTRNTHIFSIVVWYSKTIYRNFKYIRDNYLNLTLTLIHLLHSVLTDNPNFSFANNTICSSYILVAF